MRPPSTLERRIAHRLERLAAEGLRRELRPPSGADFSSNDYLGLAAHPAVVSAFCDAARREGCGSTGSRLLRGDRDAFHVVERRFARFKGAERALYFSSGYLANLAVMTTLAEQGDVLLSDERNHASLIDGMRLSAARRVIVPHNDVPALRRLLAEHAVTPDGERFLVVESLFSMDGDEAPLRDLVELCAAEGVTPIVDEAHAVGVYGARGSGRLEACGIDANHCVSINTAGKALGVAGAFVAGPAWAIEYLVQRARSFIFSTAPPPALAAAIEASLDVITREPERRARLRSRILRLRQGLASRGVAVEADGSQIVPVVIGGNDAALSVATALQREGFDVRAIRPPTVPRGTARLRISVNSELDDETIDRFAAAVAAALEEVGRCPEVSS